ncbi:MAG: glucosaminidase domain-containing protein [Hyphomicrobiaceae bacterium]|nr:glucosaminidase domain-containing protein [Hyphomicrobiaceae bacterium]
MPWAALPAQAQSLPAIKTGTANQAAACATPGRMMAFVKQRNPAMDQRFDDLATEYMRHGEALGVRWDYAFFQMLLETGNLSFSRGNGKPGNVRPAQNNFAGLGAAGRGQSGERFPDATSGVKAHLQHLLLYAGDRIENPVADRTRKVQEWGILTAWQKGLDGPVTFADLSRKWAPGDRGYSGKVGAIANAFFDEQCKGPDPRPELVAEARRGQAEARVAEAEPEAKSAGAEMMRRSVEQARAEDAPRSSLGATSIATQGAAAADPAPTASKEAAVIPESRNTGKAASEKPAAMKTASAATSAAAAAALGSSRPKCRVWTASYGGQKAIIIKAAGEGLVNYTVLDVNEGSEKRETEAYIAAYAKGGEPVGEFASQMSALDKAFELCPEG